jgi:hypothetical protein
MKGLLVSYQRPLAPPPPNSPPPPRKLSLLLEDELLVVEERLASLLEADVEDVLPPPLEEKRM